MIATVTSKGQVTIPKTVREHLGLEKGVHLDFDENAPFLKARKLRALKRNKLSKVIGCLKGKMTETTKKYLAEIRGKSDFP